MELESYHDFYVAAASVAGALIGLLFVAISVSQQRLAAKVDGPVHRTRASAALTAFTNALVVSLFSLVPGEHVGDVAVTVSIVGLLSVAAMVLGLIRAHAVRLRLLRDLMFLVGLTTVFVVQLVTGIKFHNGHGAGPLQTLATLVIVCFLLGIARSWELIGGPVTSLGGEVRDLGLDMTSRLRARNDSD